MMTDRRLAYWLRDEFQSEKLLPGLTSGLLIGITAVFIALSLGSLIFSGELASHLTDGIGIALATAAIILIAISLGSSTPGVTGSSSGAALRLRSGQAWEPPLLE